MSNEEAEQWERTLTHKWNTRHRRDFIGRMEKKMKWREDHRF